MKGNNCKTPTFLFSEARNNSVEKFVKLTDSQEITN